MLSQNSYDLVVIGSGPAGQKAALNAAKLGKRVAIIDRTESVGGVCIHTGTIPSKAIREAVLHLTAFNERQVYGDSYAVKHDITMEDLLYRARSRRADRGRHHPQPDGAQRRDDAVRRRELSSIRTRRAHRSHDRRRRRS